MSISARRFLDRVAERGLLEDQTIEELKKHIDNSLFDVPVEAVAKLLVDKGHLTAFQASKLVSEITASEEGASAPVAKPPEKPVEKPVEKPAEKPAAPAAAKPAPPAPAKPAPPPPPPPAAEDLDDLGLADLGDDFASSSKPAAPPAAAKPTPSAPAPAPLKKPEAPAAKKPASAPPKPEPPKGAPPAEDIILLEDATDEPTPPAKAPTKAPAKPAQKAPEKPAAAKPGAPKPSGGKPAPQKPAAPKAPAAPAGGLELLPDDGGLTPLGDQGLMPLGGGGLSPYDGSGGMGGLAPMGSGGGDPFAMGAPGMGGMGMDAGGLTPAAPGTAPGAQPANFKKVGAVGWDSIRFFLIGGAVLLLLIGVPLLWYVLNRGTGAEMFEQAEADYKNQSYTQAIAKYEKFIKSFPDDPNVSLGKVKRGLAAIRSMVEGSSDLRQGLKQAQEVLPQIENEDRFADARPELAGVLPTIAAGLAKQAKEAGTGAKAKELVALAREAMTLVDEPNYINSQLRPPIQSTVDGIKRTILEADRNIRQADELVAGLQKMEQSLEKNDTIGAFEVRRKLLKEFPGLETNEQMVATVLKVAAAERSQVKVESRELSASTEDHPEPADVKRVILANRRGETIEGVAGHVAFVLARGSVYGIEVGTGKVLWRRFVGFDTFAHPQPLTKQPGADVIVSDMLHQEVARLEARTGKLKWRLSIGERFAPPVIWGEKVFVTTIKGQVIEADAGTGKSSRLVQLPQPTTVELGGSTQLPHAYQAGSHSNLYALAVDTLEPKEVYYLGHREGTIAVPPVAAVNHLFVAENAGADYSLIHVLAVDEAGLKLERPTDQEPFRVQGNVISSLIQVKNRILVTTDRAALLVLEVDSANKRKPVKKIAERVPPESQPLPSQVVAEGAQLWIGNDRFMAFDIQASREQLAPKWVKHEQEWFVAPLQKFGGTLVHVRRRRGSQGVTVSAVKPDTGNILWQNDLGVPVAYLGLDAEKNALSAVTGQGELFRLTKEAIDAGQMDKPTETAEVPGSATTFALTEAGMLDQRRVLLTSDTEPGAAVVFDPARTGDELAVVRLDVGGAPINSQPFAFGGGVATTTETGAIFWLSPETGKNLGLPFQPKLGPGERIYWNRPAPLAGGKELIASDGRKRVYRVTVKDAPSVHLGLGAEIEAPEELLGPMASGGGTAFGISRGASADIVRAFPLPALAGAQEFALQGRVIQGVWTTPEAAYLVSDKEGLVSLNSATGPRWTLPVPGGTLAAPPHVDGDSLLLSTSSGVLLRVSADKGEVRSKLELNQPLGGAPVPFLNRMLAPGADGVIYATPPLP